MTTLSRSTSSGSWGMSLLFAWKRYRAVGRLGEALADISHQIRTPLTSLNLQAERLRSPALGEEEKRALLREMTGMLSRVSRLVREALRPFEISMEIHSQICVRELEPGTVIQGDYTWTLEAVQNVIKNALEHTPEGGKVWVRARSTPLFAEIQVTDSGKGISERDLSHVFERFYR